MSAPTASRSVLRLFTLLSIAAVIAALYLGRDVLMPMTLAVLLWFLISPLVKRLERPRLPRVVAVLIAAVFWTWLWGPVGLLLAVPLTASPVVLGKHVPRLRFLPILLSDEQALGPKSRLYQRLDRVQRAAARPIMQRAGAAARGRLQCPCDQGRLQRTFRVARAGLATGRLKPGPRRARPVIKELCAEGPSPRRSGRVLKVCAGLV